MDWASVKSVTIPEGDVQSVAIGGVTVWTKPSPLPYDAEVEYIESTGTQYIDTGVKQASDIEVLIGYRPVGSTVGWGTYFGCGYDDKSSNNILVRHYTTTASNLNPWFGNSNYQECQITVNTSSRIVARLKYGSCTVDGQTRAITSSAANLKTAYNMYLFSANKDNAPWRSQPCRIYALKVWKSGVPVRDYIPCRIGQTGYLFDLVSGQLFGNAGTGAFVIGPDKTGA